MYIISALWILNVIIITNLAIRYARGQNSRRFIFHIIFFMNMFSSVVIGGGGSVQGICNKAKNLMHVRFFRFFSRFLRLGL